MNCGHEIPNERLTDIVEKMGLERFASIPDSDKEIAVGTAPADILEDSGIVAITSATISPLMDAVGADGPDLKTGKPIIFPDSTPITWAPSQGRPFRGARRGSAWHPRTRHTQALIRDKGRKKNGKKVITATYVGHGRTGMRFGIDTMISAFTQRANKAEENAGDKLCNWIIANWGRLNVNYVIYWNWMNDGNGWFDYEPIRRKWDSGSQNLVASRHLDHIHVQVDSPFIAGNE